MNSVTRSDLTFRSGGDECAAWLYRPDTPTPVPGVVMAQGFTAVRDQRLDAYAQVFAEAGLAVLLFDYRHFGASAGEPRQLLSVKHQLQDWEAAIATLRAQPGVDPQRIALWGTSFGGAHVQAVAARDHGIAAVVAQIPFCWAEKPQQKVPLGKTLGLLFAALRDSLHGALGLPPHYIQAIGDPDDHAAMTSPGAAGDIRCPIHYTIAEQDAFISPATIREAASLAADAEISSYPCGHFGVYVEPLFSAVARDETAFLLRHLTADAD